MSWDLLRRPPAHMSKPEGLRQSMSWLHTWSGLLLGWILFAMFLTGTLAFFRPEITAWMKPELRVPPVTQAQSVEVAQRYLQTHAPTATRWFITPSTPRTPEVLVSYQDPKAGTGRGSFRQARLDPSTGEAVTARATRGGDFFYRFHFELGLANPWGRWLASIAGMFMLVAIVTGVITHKKIFADFFTFRPGKGQRAWMDGHNALSVLGLPFHLMITFSGVILFMTMLMPAGVLAVYDTERHYFDEAFPAFAQAPASPIPATVAPLAAMVQVAQQDWQGRVGRIVVNHPGNAAAMVSISGNVADRISNGRLPPSITFDGVTGEVRQRTAHDTALKTTAGTLIGLHLGLFAEPVLRWVYFLVSLAGTAMVATGLLLWVSKRRQKAGQGTARSWSMRVVEALNVGTVAGTLLATAAFFWANRLIDPALAGRAALEVNVFFYTWGASMIYAFVRPRQGWRDLLLFAAVAWLALPLVNGLTTDRHLLVSLPGRDWVFAGFDLCAVAAGGALAWMAGRAARSARTQRCPS